MHLLKLVIASAAKQSREPEPERHHTYTRRHEVNNSLPLLDYCVLAIGLKPDSGSRGAIA
jgi:hypothetical protein